MSAAGAFGYLSDYVLWWVLLLSLLVHTWLFFRWFPWRRRRRLGLVLGNGLVFLSLVGTAAMVAETYLRFFRIDLDSFGVSVPAQRWFARYVKLNSRGFRDAEWAAVKPPSLRRIAFLGDSFTYGWGIERVEDRFPDRIAAAWNGGEAGTVEVLNAAKPGWGTKDHITATQEMIATYGVDEIVLCYVPNDIESVLPTTPTFDPTNPPAPIYFDLRSSCLLDFLFRTILLPRAPTVRGYHDWLADGYDDAELWHRQEERLAAIINHCRNHGVTLRVVLLPFLRTGGTKYQAAGVHERLTRFLQRNGVPVLDLLPVIAGEHAEDLVISGKDPHPNERAHALFADAIWKAFFAAPAPRP